MSHFVYLVRVKEPALIDLALPQIPDTKITNNVFGAYFATYGDFAEWLRVRLEETLDYYTYDPGYWGDNRRCYTPDPHPNWSWNTRAQQLNQQAGFACALFYLGSINHNPDYLQKATYVARAYKGKGIETIPRVDDLCLFSYQHSYDVMEVRPDNDSYIWRTNGWRHTTCSEYVDGTNDFEDISHGVITLLFPRTINNQPLTGGEVVVTTADMVRYRNTFGYNVFKGYDADGCPEFLPGVDGDDYIAYNPQLTGDILKSRSLAWMPFYKYDNHAAAPFVYDIVMDYYACYVLNDVKSIELGMEYMGLSEVVAAQWDRECVSLTLYNRIVSYDQDFFVEKRLIVAPGQSGNGPSFAEPTTTDKTFTIEPEVTVNMAASEEIVLGPGFEAKAGSSFHASIDPSLCRHGMAVPPNLLVTYSALPPPPSEASLILVPNPSSNGVDIRFALPQGTKVELAIFDPVGRHVRTVVDGVRDAGRYVERWDGRDESGRAVSAGTYFSRLHTDQGTVTARAVILNRDGR